MSLVIRYQRWWWILRLQHGKTPWGFGLLSYFAGFAFTATPGKLGELARAYYYDRIGVASSQVVSAFIVERFFDLIAVIAIASTLLWIMPRFYPVGIAVLVMIAVVWLTIVSDTIFSLLFRHRLSMRWRWSRSLYRYISAVRKNARTSLTPGLSTAWFLAGLAAWGLTALVFLLLCNALDFQVPALYATAVYPLAMLAGAVTFIPGGVGSTELAIIVLLAGVGIDSAEAAALAILIRLMTLWLATLLGLLAMSILNLPCLNRKPA